MPLYWLLYRLYFSKRDVTTIGVPLPLLTSPPSLPDSIHAPWQAAAWLKVRISHAPCRYPASQQAWLSEVSVLLAAGWPSTWTVLWRLCQSLRE